MNLVGTRYLHFGPELGVARHESSFLFIFVTLTSNADGRVSGSVEYDVFGKVVTETGVFVSSSGGMTNLVFGYAGKPYDPVTGLSDYGFRDYAPTLARFTTVDPIRDGSNWYAYCNSDPVNYVDAWGLDIISFIKDDFIHLATKNVETLTKQPHVPNPVFDAVDDFCETTATQIGAFFNRFSVSVTVRAVSPGAGMTLTISKDGVELGGGLGTDLAASATLDLAFRIPITSPAGFSLDLGLSGTIPGTTIGSMGGDIVWNENGLYIGCSVGVGVGAVFETHLLVTDDVSQDECEKQRY